MASIFKAYDIRGIYGKDLTDDLAERIGRAFATFLKCRTVVIGQDMRPHSKPLFDALARGLTQQGADVISIGLSSTPMSYYANGSLKADAGIMITASHNTGEWNGFKLSRSQAVPISGQTGIKEIEQIVLSSSFAPTAASPGSIREHDIAADYARHIASLFKINRPIRVAADFANAMGVLEARALKGLIEIDPLFDTLDGSFPNHEANPLKRETLDALCKKVAAGKYDFGVAFDGDADRAGFVDERGKIIPMDMTTALIARNMLQRQKGAILYDLRSSWAVREVIEENAGAPFMCRVGHAFIKQQMREENALFAGELSGHYYFRDNFFTESSAMAVLHLASLLAASDKPLSSLIAPLCRYSKSEEINFEVHDHASVFNKLRDAFSNAKIFELDGLSFEYPDWWFNVRASNTEPLMRVNLEAKTSELLATNQEKVFSIIGGTPVK